MSAKRNLLIGVGIGVVLGILFAPHKGIKTRKKLAEHGAELKDGWLSLKESVTNTFTKFDKNDENYFNENEIPVYINSSMQEEWRGLDLADEWKQP